MTVAAKSDRYMSRPMTMTAYNGVTEIETRAVQRLLANLRKSTEQ